MRALVAVASEDRHRVVDVGEVRVVEPRWSFGGLGDDVPTPDRRGGNFLPPILSRPPVRTHFTPLTLALLLATAGCATSPPARTPSILPLRALRLYETGVGYFERSGQIGDASATALPVPAGHLDDALKSLVILNGGAGGQISGLSFASSVSQGVARSRAGLPVDGDKPITHRDLLVSLKGEQIELVDEAGALVGRVIEVTEEPADPPKEAARDGSKADAPRPEGAPRMVPVVTILSDKGEIVKRKGADLHRIRPLDPGFAARLDRALDALSPRSTQRTRPLQLLGDARGAITFGYIAETPLWRTTYRLLIGPESKGGKLQGWALVHNDTDEDWDELSLSLVNGQPDSFLFPLAAPRYVHRTLVHPDGPLSTIPQLQDQTADRLWGDNPGGGDSYGYGAGYGSSHGRLGSSHRARAPSIRMGSTSISGAAVGRSTLLSVGNLADVAAASGAEQGALFTYTAAKPFSLPAHSSALVPFLQTPIDVELVAWFADASTPARIAVRFTNDTGQTLPAGTLAVFAHGGFTGEGALDRRKPGERRFVQFGNELDAEITEKKRAVTEEPKRLTFAHGRLAEHFLRKSRIAWEIENRAASARPFYVGYDADRNAAIAGADALDFDEERGRPVLVFRLPAKQKVVRSFDVTEGLSRSDRFEAFGEKRLRELAGKRSLPPGEAAVAAEAATRAKDVEAAQRAIDAETREIASIEADVERLRDHLKALGGDKGGAGPAAAPLVKRLLDAEDRLAAANKRRAALKKDHAAKIEALRATLSKLPAPQ